MRENRLKEQGYLVLYNPISNEGHLDSWHVLFIELLVTAGWRVIALTHDLTGLESKLETKGIAPGPSLHLLSAKNVIQPKAVTRRVINKLKRILNRVIKRELVSVSHLKPDTFQQQIDFVVDKYPDCIAGIFNMYLDVYDNKAEPWINFKLKENIPWMGLCITPIQDVLEGYYQANNFKGTCFLDETISIHYKHLIPKCEFEYLPDITETLLPEYSSELARKIKQISGERKIVFLGGSIGKQKNLACWYELIRQADVNKWFFVQIGRLNLNNLSPEDEVALKSVRHRPPENLFLMTEYLPDERAFNEIIALSDIIFAVYRDFYRSSNMLSKAAFFDKPLMVSDNGLMGKRVKQYGIGVAVPQSDVTKMLESLELLSQIPDFLEKTKKYRDHFSAFIVQQKLNSFLKACIGN